MHDTGCTRRTLIGGSLGIFLGSAASAVGDLRSIEQREQLRIGLFAQTMDGRTIWSHRADERFLLCSTFKIFLVASVLRMAEREPDLLGRQIPLVPARLLTNSPVTGQKPFAVSLSVEQLCAAAVEYSDNSAANYLLEIIGGPAAVTHTFRMLGDNVSRLDRIEPDLNRPDSSMRDTTSPRAMARSLARLTQSPMLSAAGHARLLGWMTNEHNGVRRIRAGMPIGWQVADKPGTNDSGSVNDVALLQSPAGRRFVLAIYARSSVNDIAKVERVIAEVAGSFARQMGPSASRVPTT